MKVFIACPAYNGMVSTLYMQSVMNLPAAGVGIEWSSADDSLVPRGRNLLVARFLESNIQHVLFVDADIGFVGDQVVAMLKFNQDFVAGVVPVKGYYDGGLKYAATPMCCP